MLEKFLYRIAGKIIIFILRPHWCKRMKTFWDFVFQSHENRKAQKNRKETFCDLETFCSVVCSFSIFLRSFFLFEGTSDLRPAIRQCIAGLWVMKDALGLISRSHYYEANTHPHLPIAPGVNFLRICLFSLLDNIIMNHLRQKPNFFSVFQWVVPLNKGAGGWNWGRHVIYA